MSEFCMNLNPSLFESLQLLQSWAFQSLLFPERSKILFLYSALKFLHFIGLQSLVLILTAPKFVHFMVQYPKVCTFYSTSKFVLLVTAPKFGSSCIAANFVLFRSLQSLLFESAPKFFYRALQSLVFFRELLFQSLDLTESLQNLVVFRTALKVCSFLHTCDDVIAG